MLASRNGDLAPQLQQLKDKQQLGNTEKKLQDQQAAYADKNNRSKTLTEYLYRNYPPKLDRVLPSRLGNIIKAAEEYPYERYGIDAVFFWPRLIAVVPDAARGDLSDARASMALLLNVSTLAFLLGVGSFAALAAAMLNPAAAFWACGAGGLVLAALAYRSALAPGRIYAELVRAAFDLYRVDLLKQLNFGLPDNLDEERALWQSLGQQMYLGAATSPDVLDAARARTVNPPPSPVLRHRLAPAARALAVRHLRMPTTSSPRKAGIRAPDAADLSPFVANHPCSGAAKPGVGEPVPAGGIVTVDVTTSS